jgi:hypothetical protein
VHFLDNRKQRHHFQKKPGNTRRNLLEQFQQLAGHRRLRNVETGDVAARPREARDEAAADRIGNVRENDGDGARLLQQRGRGGCDVRKKSRPPRDPTFLSQATGAARVHSPMRFSLPFLTIRYA